MSIITSAVFRGTMSNSMVLKTLSNTSERAICILLDSFDAALLIQFVLDEFTRLEDDGEVAPLLGEQREVGEGVAIDDDQIGMSPRLDHADLTRHADQLRGDRCCGSNNIDRRQHPAAIEE